MAHIPGLLFIFDVLGQGVVRDEEMANKEQKIDAKLLDAAKSHRRFFVAPPKVLTN